MNDERRRQDLADFLRTRRMRLSPEQVGLINAGRRRTPGLRREEVAQLANVGISWYTQLEQGRDIRPSGEVLESIADGLQLTPEERRHLFLLADQPLSIESHPADEEVSPTLRCVLEALNPLPAYIIGHRWDYLAWNTAAEHILLLIPSPPPHENNAVWRMFASPQIRHLYSPPWEEIAQRVLAEFRADTAHCTDEAWFKELVTDLQRISPEFRAWWPRHDVGGKIDALKGLTHPVMGSMMFEHTTLQAPARPDWKLMIYTPVPGTGTREKLQQLMEQGVAMA